mmetsp:Transcript_57137/g.135878  ORF Transcript_57137/g.135878 Transcript_57137/m.135878 type:complete len:265 (-) Transcript_57137:243-1037(-)
MTLSSRKLASCLTSSFTSSLFRLTIFASSATGTRTGRTSEPPASFPKLTAYRTRARLNTDLPLPAGATSSTFLPKVPPSGLHISRAMSLVCIIVPFTEGGAQPLTLSSISSTFLPVTWSTDTAKEPMKVMRSSTRVLSLACTAAKPPFASSIARSIITASLLTEHWAVSKSISWTIWSTNLAVALVEFRVISPSGQKRRNGSSSSVQRHASNTHHFLCRGLASLSKTITASRERWLSCFDIVATYWSARLNGLVFQLLPSSTLC